MASLLGDLSTVVGPARATMDNVKNWFDFMRVLSKTSMAWSSTNDAIFDGVMNGAQRLAVITFCESQRADIVDFKATP